MARVKAPPPCQRTVTLTSKNSLGNSQVVTSTVSFDSIKTRDDLAKQYALVKISGSPELYLSTEKPALPLSVDDIRASVFIARVADIAYSRSDQQRVETSVGFYLSETGQLYAKFFPPGKYASGMSHYDLEQEVKKGMIFDLHTHPFMAQSATKPHYFPSMSDENAALELGIIRMIVTRRHRAIYGQGLVRPLSYERPPTLQPRGPLDRIKSWGREWIKDVSSY